MGSHDKTLRCPACGEWIEDYHNYRIDGIETEDLCVKVHTHVKCDKCGHTFKMTKFYAYDGYEPRM